jgi:hypothetical protein
MLAASQMNFKRSMSSGAGEQKTLCGKAEFLGPAPEVPDCLIDDGFPDCHVGFFSEYIVALWHTRYTYYTTINMRLSGQFAQVGFDVSAEAVGDLDDASGQVLDILNGESAGAESLVWVCPCDLVSGL